MFHVTPTRPVGLHFHCLLALALLLARPLPACGQAAGSPLSLEAAIRQALERNPEVRAAARETDAARARRRQAGALEAPILTYEAGKLGTSVTREERETSVRLSQGFPLPPQRSRALELGAAEVAIAEEQQESVALRLRGDVTRAYRRLQVDVLALSTLGELQNSATDLEELTGNRLRSGGAGYLDALRARVERVRLGNEVIEAERSLQANRRTLNVLLARASDQPIEPSDSLSFVALTDSLPELVASALASRPRVRLARLQARREGAALAQAKSLFLPTAEISIGVDRVPGSDTPGVGFGVSITLPFAPWTDRRARVAEARALEGSAQARLETTEREVEALVRDAYANARSAGQLVTRLQGSLLPDAQDAVHAAVQGYQFGQIDGLALFETLRTYRSVQLEYVRSLLNYELALTDLTTAE
ncbi:MAG: TolC family protein [Candidatus Eisenbacteria bacterium]